MKILILKFLKIIKIIKIFKNCNSKQSIYPILMQLNQHGKVLEKI